MYNIKDIRLLIARGEIEQAIEQSLSLSNTSSEDSLNLFMQISSEFQQLKKERALGIIYDADYRVNFNRIVNSLLSALKDFKKMQANPAGTSVSTNGNMKEIFISYAWSDDNKAIVEALEVRLQTEGFMVYRDTTSVGYRSSIGAFMQEMGSGKSIIAVIGQSYLRSKSCMYELVQIDKHSRFRQRVYPILLRDAGIFSPIEVLEHIKYWEDKTKELESAMREVSQANLHGIRETLDVYVQIRAAFAYLTEIIGDMNALTPAEHLASGFQEIITALHHA